MSTNELRQAVFDENEAAFSMKGRTYLLYGWEQCDGYVLSLEKDGELVWQTLPKTKKECIEEFMEYYPKL